MKFTPDPSHFNYTGHYVSGRWSIHNTRPKYWELHLDGIKVMGYTSFKAAKAGADEYAQQKISQA